MSKKAEIILQSISKIEERLSNEPDPKLDKQLVKNIVSLYEGTIPNIKSGLSFYNVKRLFDNDITLDLRGDLSRLKEKLELYLASIEDDEKDATDISASASSSAGQKITIQNNPNIHINTEASSSSSSSSSVTISQVFEELDKCDLNDEYANEVRKALQELENSKSGRFEDVCEKGSQLLDLIKKSEEVAKPVLLYLGQMLLSLLS